MTVLRVRLFGKFSVSYNNQAVHGLEACKVQELFSYLLLHHDRPHARETLANLLWSDNGANQSKKYLRQALWQLQSALSQSTEINPIPLLHVDPDWVRLGLHDGCWLDVALFEQAFLVVQGIPGQQLDAASVHILRDVIQHYQGDLLEGCYEDWCLFERERFQNMYLAMLDKLMAYSERHQQYEDGLVYGARILRLDVAREHTHRQMMRLYYLAGDRTTALRQFEQCAAALHAELGVKPSKSTLALHEQIRADDASPSAATLQTLPSLLNAPLPMPDVLSQLKQLQTVLASLEHQVQQNIHAVEQALGSKHP